MKRYTAFLMNFVLAIVLAGIATMGTVFSHWAEEPRTIFGFIVFFGASITFMVHDIHMAVVKDD